MADANRESFWGALSGKEGSRMPIIDKTGPLKQKGDQLDFNIIGQLMGAGVTGESALIGSEEGLSVGTFTVSADYVRHAVGVTKKSNRQANYDQVKTCGMLLKDWMQRKMDSDVFTTIINGATNTIYANGKTSVGALCETDGDVFGPSEIDLIRLALQRQGALPILAKQNNGRTVPIYGIVIGEVEEYRLLQNTTFVQTIQNAMARFTGGENHPLFKGGLGMYKNMVIYPYYSINPIPQGTPLRPETIVYATLTTAATLVSVGGASANAGATPSYTVFFASSGSLQIEDEMITYTGKTVNSFTGLTRGVSGSTAVQHSNNKIVTQRNVSTVIGFGAEAVCRAIGDSPTPIGDKRDYGAAIGLGIEAYYGQALKKDQRRSTTSGVVVCKVYSENPSTV
jgi:N4-gp56 family major capsid protein